MNHMINHGADKSHRNLHPLLFVTLFCAICLLIAGCEPSQQQRLAQKAKEKVAECKALGDRSVQRLGRCLVWRLERDSVHGVHSRLDSSMRYSDGDGPVTVFLVSAKRNQQLGTYSISKQPAYREWVDVCVVQFTSSMDSGIAIAAHEIVSLDPRQRRPVQHQPEYGDPAPPIANWIQGLPSK
jgi:hypothetical protein